MSDIKKLKKLYSEYQKIKGMSDGGKVEHDKHNLKELKISFNKFMDEESEEPKKYSDGGEVDSDDNGVSNAIYNLGKSVKNAFSTPDPTPTSSPSPSKQDKYAKIRAQNATNASGKTSVMDQQTYSEGGEVEETLDKQITPKQIIPLESPVSKPKKDDPRYGGTLDLGKTLDNLPNYDDGGQVQDSNPVLDVIQKMGQAFGSTPPPAPASSLDDKYAAIRAQNSKNAGYSKGGRIKGYDDGGEVEETPVDDSDDAMVQKYRKLGMLKGPTVATKDQANITASPTDQVEAQDDQEEVDNTPKDNGPYSGEEEDAHKSSDATTDAQMALENLDDEKLDHLHEQVTNEKNKRDQQRDTEESKDDSDETQRQPASEDESSDAKMLDEDSSKPEDKKDEDQQPSLQDQLTQAQADRRRHLMFEQLAKGGALLGAGIAGHGAQAANPAYMHTNGLAEAPVQDVQEKIAMQQNDPNSSVSKVARDYYKSKGINVPDSTSYSDISKVAPFYLKDDALKNAIKKVTMQQQGANQRNANTQSAEDKRAANKLAIEKQKADAMQKAAEGNKELKGQANQDRALQQTKQMLESARGNPAAAQAEKDLYSVDKINSLYKLYPNIDKMPDAQVGLVAQEIAKVATGGVPPGHGIDAVKPNTPESRLQKFFGQLQNHPNGANLGAYLKELKKYGDTLHNDAQKVIQDKYGRVIESSKKQLGDDNYKMLQDQYLNRFNTSEAPPIDADLTKMNHDQLQAYIKAHGAQ